MLSMATPAPAPVRRALRELGDHLGAWRRLRNLTETEVAERAGVSRGTVQRMSHDPGSVSVENFMRIARALGILDEITSAADPLNTDLGRLRAEEHLPQRVRHPAR